MEPHFKFSFGIYLSILDTLHHCQPWKSQISFQKASPIKVAFVFSGKSKCTCKLAHYQANAHPETTFAFYGKSKCSFCRPYMWLGTLFLHQWVTFAWYWGAFAFSGRSKCCLWRPNLGFDWANILGMREREGERGQRDFREHTILFRPVGQSPGQEGAGGRGSQPTTAAAANALVADYNGDYEVTGRQMKKVLQGILHWRPTTMLLILTKMDTNFRQLWPNVESTTITMDF